MIRHSHRAIVVVSVLACCLPAVRGQANDDCLGAQLIAHNTFTAGNTSGATTVPYLASCNSGKDVWYRFVAPYSGTAELSTCSFLGGAASFDTVISAWVWFPGWQCAPSGPNGGPTSCNDDYCGSQSYLSFPISYGATYYVAVGGWAGASGTFTLAFLTSPNNEPNDFCSGAIPIGFSWPVSGETFGAGTGGGDPIASCGFMAKDVWYSFVAPACGTYTLTTCDDADFDTVIAVWQGSCGALTQIACNDDNCAVPGYNLNSTVSFNGVMGTTYYVSLGGFYGAAGAYTLTLSGTAPAAMSLSFVNNGPGTIGYAITNGPANGLAFTALTLLPGAYPNGWFHGIDVAIPDLVSQWSSGYPFIVALGAACTSTTVGPFPGLPSGMTLYGVSLGVSSPGSTTPIATPPASGTVP